MYRKLSIKSKLIIAFSLVIAIFVSISAVTIINVTKLMDTNAAEKNSQQIIAKLDELQRIEMTVGTSIQQSTSKTAKETLKEVKEEYNKNIDDLISMTKGDAQQQKLLDTIREEGDKKFSNIEQIINSNTHLDNIDLGGVIAESMRPDDMKDSLDSNAPNKNTLDNSIREVSEIEEDHIKDRGEEINDIGRITFIMLIGGTFLAVIISIVIFVIINKSVVHNIRKTSEMLKDIAEGDGDLTKRLDIKNDDEIGEMAKWFNLFINKISKVIEELITNSDLLYKSTEQVLIAISESNSGMTEVAYTVENVSGSIQNSASASEEAMASIEEIASQSDMIYCESKEANINGEKVLSAALEGEVAVKEAVETIDTAKLSSIDVLNVISELKEASDEIGKIVSMITGITEQTSLLSLNASIEAARAGEAGKGFAVVADEVKKLSEESKKSAQQIDSIVDHIQRKIDQTGSIISKEQSYIATSADKILKTSQEFNKILTYIQNISEKIKTVAESSQHQSDVTNEMTKSINVLSQGLQDNATASNQISAAVQNQVNIYKNIELNMENIKNISNSLKLQTEKFKL